jgi:hypothetical protein
MVTDLAQALRQLVEDRKDLTNSEPDVKDIDKLAKKFTELSDKITSNQPFDENDTKNLADRLNEFSSMRSKIFKDYTKQLGIGLIRNENSTKGEEHLLRVMGNFTEERGIAWNRIGNVKEDHLIPGLKYIVGHDQIKYYSMYHDNKIILADCARSSGYNGGGLTRASYAIAKPQFLLEKKFSEDLKIEDKQMTREESAREAEEVYGEYLEIMAKKERIAAGRKESHSKYLEYESVNKKNRQQRLLSKRRSSIPENIVVGKSKY